MERISCDWLYPAHCSDLSKQEVDIGKEEVFIANTDLQIPSCVCVYSVGNVWKKQTLYIIYKPVTDSV